jgi:hypothetical protein
MLPRAAPRPRAGACTLESSLRCLRTSDHRALPWGVGNSRKWTSPRRCWTGASRAGICLPRGAHAAPGCPEAPSRRLHPGVLPPLPAHLESYGCPGGDGNSRKSTSPDDAGPALQEPASAYPEARMLPRAAPRPRAGACTLESSLRCLRTSDHMVVRGVLEIRENRPPPTMLDRRFKSRHLLTQRRACCPGLPRGPEQAPAPWSPPSAACAPRIIQFSVGCWKFKKMDLPPTMLDRRFKSRHLLTQRRACCPGLPRGPEQAPAPWSPRSAACAPRIIEFSRGVLEIRKKSTCPRRCWTGASRAGICLPRGAHAAPGCPEAPSRRLHPGVLPPLPAHLGSSSFPGGVGNSRKSTSPPRCWTGASRAGICLPRDAHAAPGCPEAPSRRLHPGVLPPLPAHLGSYGCPGGVGNSRKSTSPDDAGPALQEPASAYPEARMLPRAAPRPRAGACTLESSLRCLRTSDHTVVRGVLEIRENRPPPDDAGPALQEPASACPEVRMLPRAAPRLRAGACTLESSLRCLRTSDHTVLRGVLEIQENGPPPNDAGPALQEPASAYPEARMLPRAAPRPRAGACTLESSLRCLRTSDHRVLPGVLEIRKKSTCPRRCWTGASRAGICLPRGAHAAPGCPEAPSRRLHPGVLPPLPAHLGSSSSPGGVGNSRKSTSPRRCWTGASRAGICLPRGAHAAPGCPEAPSRRLHPGVLPPLPAQLGSSSSPGGVGNSRKSTSPRRCWTGASRAGICLPRGTHAAPGCPEAPSRRLHPGVLPPLPAHLRSYGCPGGVGNSRKSTSPDDAGPALQEPASAYPEARMLPRAAPRLRAGACTLESSLRCLRTSDHTVLRGVLEIQENGPPPNDAGPALQEPASAYPEARMLPRAAPRPRAGACTLESSLRCLRTSDHRALRGV